MADTSILHKLEQRLDNALNINPPSHAHGSLPSQAHTTETHPDQQEDDLDTIADEEVYQEIRRHSTNRTTSSQTGVDVKRAEAHFAELNRQLSHISRTSGRLSRTNSKVVTVQAKDVEKAGSSADSEDSEQFDLERTLRQSKQMEEEAGIKDKQIGMYYAQILGLCRS